MKRGCSLIILVLALLTCWIPPAFGTNKSEEVKQLKSAEKEERRILVELEELNRRIGKIEDRLAPIDEEIAVSRKEMARTNRRIEDLEKNVRELRKYLGRRMRALYKIRQGGILQVLLQSESVHDLMSRYRYLTLILHKDEVALNDYSRRNEELKAMRMQLKAEQAKLLDLRGDVEKEMEKLRIARHKKTTVLMEVHRKKELYIKLINSREESRQRLIKEVIIEPREKKAATKIEKKKPVKKDEPDKKKTSGVYPNFAAHKGKIPRPVPGRIKAGFGKNKGPFNTVIKKHGMIFQTVSGTSVRAVMGGKVLYTGWLKGYGNIIIIDHGKRYYTLTGGIAGIRHSAGQWVNRGDILGLAPRGGQEDKKDIYFEIRHKGLPLNPAPWLGKKPAA